MDYQFNNTQQQALNTVIDLLIVHLEPEAVYCFGMRQECTRQYNAFAYSSPKQQHTHFYLLVITRSSLINATADVGDIIKVSSEGNITATLLIHKPKEVLYAKGSQRHFFDAVTGNARLVYGSNEFQPKEDMEQQSPVHCYSPSFWEYRHKTAVALLEAEKVLHDEEVLQVNATMLHLATEHLCLGLIGILSGYRPNHFGLGYLFDICRLFCPEATALFPRNGGEGQRLFRILSLHLSQLRHHDHNNITAVDIEILRGRVAQFLEKAVQRIEAEAARTGAVQPAAAITE